MITASIKKRENIAEYLLYMWQIEDIIRAYNLDIDAISKNIIQQYTGIDDAKRKEMTEWYESLIDMMRREGVAEKGHLQLNVNTLNDIRQLHRKLMEDTRFPAYNAEFYKVLPYIVEIRAKAGDDKKDEIESAFNLLYGILMLRLRRQEISAETKAAADEISRFLAMLAAYYKKDYNNELFKEDDNIL